MRADKVKERFGRGNLQRESIDFVITWVDGGDDAWRSEKRRFAIELRPDWAEGEKCAGNDDSEERYRDWDNLRYWFRGVEKYAPWVRKIHFVTCGHLPDWLLTSHPKLHIVRHEDYIPKKYLPTFNSHTIEWHLHKIKGLSEQFVYFNDDIFLLRAVLENDFFEGGLPCDMLAFQPVVANPDNPVMSHIFLNNSIVLSKYFTKRENVKMQIGNYLKPGYPPLYFFYNIMELAFPLFTGFYTVHGPSPFLKRTFDLLWEREGALLDATCSHRFRNEADVNQYLVREWQKLTGNFKAKNITGHFRYFDVASDNPKLVDTILRQRADIICINDANKPIDFAHAKRQIIEAFEKIFPEKSSFEKG